MCHFSKPQRCLGILSELVPIIVTHTVQIHFQIPQRNNRSAPVSPRKAAKIEEARSILHIPEYQEIPIPARRVIRYREVANQRGYPDLGINMM